MKKPNFLGYAVAALLVAGLVAFTAPSAKAQVSATSNARVEISTPISIAKDTDMDFGTLSAPTGSAAAKWILTPSGGLSEIAGTNSVDLFTLDHHESKFTATGESGAAYDIAASVTTNFGATASGSLSLDELTTDPPIGSGTGLLSSTQVIKVGGRLLIDPFTTKGTNGGGTPAEITVTVNY